jgi:hypothetical protein
LDCVRVCYGGFHLGLGFGGLVLSKFVLLRCFKFVIRVGGLLSALHTPKSCVQYLVLGFVKSLQYLMCVDFCVSLI